MSGQDLVRRLHPFYALGSVFLGAIMDRPNDISDNPVVPNFTGGDIGEIQSPAGQISSRYSRQQDTAQLVSAGVLPGISIIEEIVFQQPSKGDRVTLPPDSVQPQAAPPAENADRTNDQLISQLGSAIFQRREAATQALEERGLCALPEMLRAHNHSDLETNRRVTRVIDRIGTAGIPLMLAALEGNDPQLRAGAERSLARLSLESILDYVGANNNDPQRIQQAQRILSSRNGWEDQVSGMLVRDNESGRFPPNSAQEFRRAIAGAQLLDSHTNVFHLSLEEGRFLLNSGSHHDAIDSLDRSLNTLARHLANDTGRVLFAVDIAQQLRDHLGSPAGDALPQPLRAAINLRIERAQDLQERFGRDN